MWNRRIIVVLVVVAGLIGGVGSLSLDVRAQSDPEVARGRREGEKEAAAGRDAPPASEPTATVVVPVDVVIDYIEASLTPPAPESGRTKGTLADVERFGQRILAEGRRKGGRSTIVASVPAPVVTSTEASDAAADALAAARGADDEPTIAAAAQEEPAHRGSDASAPVVLEVGPDASVAQALAALRESGAGETGTPVTVVVTPVVLDADGLVDGLASVLRSPRGPPILTITRLPGTRRVAVSGEAHDIGRALGLIAVWDVATDADAPRDETALIEVNHADPSQVYQIVAQWSQNAPGRSSGPSGSVALTLDKRTSRIIVQARDSQLIADVRALVRELDVPLEEEDPPEVVLRTIRVLSRSASEVLQITRSLYSELGETARGSSSVRRPVMRSPRARIAQPAEIAAEKMSIVTDEATGLILVRGAEDEVRALIDALGEVDAILTEADEGDDGAADDAE